LCYRLKKNNANVKASVYTPATINPRQVDALQRHLKGAVDPHVQITVHSIVGGTATAESLQHGLSRNHLMQLAMSFVI